MLRNMGAKTFFVVAVAALGWSVTGGAQAPRPGALETYKDWTVGCDNRNRCEAVLLLPQDGEWPEAPVFMGVTRDAGPGGAVEIWVSRDLKGAADLSFVVDGRSVTTLRVRDGEGTLRGPQATALAIAMAKGQGMDVRAGTRSLGHPSLAGIAAALRYIDARQGRAGTSTALVATGAMGAVAVRPAPAAPVIRRAIVPTSGTVAPLWREELTALGKFTDCTSEMDDDVQGGPSLHRLSKTETLILVPCGSGAYNFTTIPVIATGKAGRRSFRYPIFDLQPGWVEDAAQPQLVNANWDAARSRLDTYAKGRGIGDCGSSSAYVWDGVRFRLAESAMMGECRGASKWITTWTADITQ